MSIHSSFKRAEKMAKARSVMKRSERLKWLAEKGKWNEHDSVVGLPKIKVVKVKTAKKEKAKEEPKPEEGASPEIKPAATA